MEKINIESNYKVFNIEETKNILLSRINLEQSPNIIYMVKQISDCFNQTINELDKEKIKGLLEKIKMAENYLGEKFRDNPDQRLYIEKVEEVINYLTRYLQNSK